MHRAHPALMALVAVLCLGACAGIGPAAPLPAATAPAKPAVAATQPAAGRELAVDIGDNEFSPKELSIPAGATVVWTNKGRRQHTVTAADGAFDSGTLASGATFSRTFDAPGALRYYCAFHGDAGGNGMAATISVTVTAAAAPAAAAPTAVAVAPTVAAPPTVAPTAAPPPPPTATLAPTATAVVVKPVGKAIWRDQTLRNDALQIAISDLPAPPAGQVYGAWLLGKDRNLFLGPVTHDGVNAARLSFTAPGQENLLGLYERIAIMRGAEAEIATQPGNGLLNGALPEKALVHVRHILVSIGITPNKTGFVLGLRQETDETLRHAQFLRDAFNEKNLALEKLHAEHLINMIEGAKGEHYGDLNRNGKIDNPGDGYGILQNGDQDGYVKGMSDHAKLAADSPDATEDVKVHGGHVQIAGENTRARAAEIRDRALTILKAGAVAETQGDMQRILALAQQTVSGLDLNGDEQIAPVPGEGGVVTAYQHAQLMVVLALTVDGASQPATAAPAQPAAPAEPAAPTKPADHSHTPTPAQPAAPTAAPAPAAPTAAPAPAKPTAPAQPTAAAKPAGGADEVAIADFTYTPKVLKVPVGATVTWVNRGQAPHTVTADDGSFASDTLRNGQSFTFTFTKAGTFAYSCEFHGGPGGVGMAGVIQVG